MPSTARRSKTGWPHDNRNGADGHDEYRAPRWRFGKVCDKLGGMTILLEKALQRVGALPEDDQDAIASQILAALADEEAWRRRFAEKREVLRRLAQEAVEEDARGVTRSLDELL